jgi:hypothetical protein
MNDELAEQLYKNNPILFENNELSIDVGDGWFTIIDTLCSCICSEVDKLNGELTVCTDEKQMRQLYTKLVDARNRLPRLVQIKEKFGELRFYYSRNAENSERIDALVSFAEDMCSRTCSYCGSPGKKLRQGEKTGWVSVICEGCQGTNFKIGNH